MSLFNFVKETTILKEQSLNPIKPCTFYLESKGVECTAAVKKEDLVEMGQVLGKEKGDLSIPLLSSVKGRVIEVKEVYNTEGKKVKAIVVEPEESDQINNEEVDLNNLNKEEVLSMIQSFGLNDENGVPLSIKYRAFSGNKLLIKRFSSEPNLAYYDILQSKQNEINKALEVLKKVFESIEIIDVNSKSVSNKTIELKREQLVKKICGDNTQNENVLIEDLLTLVYIGECFLTSTPHLYEYVTVTGKAVNGNLLLRVKLGTSLSEIYENLGGNLESLGKVIVGGSFRGIPQYNIDTAVSNNMRGIIFLDAKEASKSIESPCIRCAKCLRACPEGLNPIKLMELWERGEKEEFIKFGGNKCIECGLCSYVCPSKIEVANKIVTAKKFIK